MKFTYINNFRLCQRIKKSSIGIGSDRGQRGVRVENGMFFAMRKRSVDDVGRFAHCEIEDRIFVGHHHAIDGDMVVYTFPAAERVAVHWNSFSIGENADDSVFLGDYELVTERDFHPELLSCEENFEKRTQARVSFVDDARKSWTSGLQENVVMAVQALIVPGCVASAGMGCSDVDSVMNTEGESLRSIGFCGQV